MSKTKKTKDDPVFPNNWGDSGMSLRDYFAALAMQGTLAASGNQDGFVDFDDGVVAESSYQLADAMLKARGEE